MKLKYDFQIRNVAGEYVLIPMGTASLKFSGMVSTNGVGSVICECLKEHTTRQAILAKLLDTFEVEEATARQDMDEFLARLEKADLLEP